MTSLLDDESLPTDYDGLTAEIAEIDKRLAACQQELKLLLAEEDFASGVFRAGEIHTVKQTRMGLRYQKDLRLARQNCLRLTQ